MTYETHSHPFAPVFNSESRILILGSFPSVKSRENAFYYGHPQNRFWKVLACVFAEETPQTIEEKTAFLLRHHIALWDVIAHCDIIGSGDSSIRNAQPTELPSVLDRSSIKHIFLNGQTAGKLYAKYHGELKIPCTVLPSTSPANAAWTLQRLTEAWGAAIFPQAGD